MPRPEGVIIAPHSDAEEAAINRGIAEDPDTFEMSDEDFARARPASEMMPPEVYKALVERRVRGPQKSPPKQLISVRLDHDLVERLRATGPGWQGRLNTTLRQAVMGKE